MFKIRIIAVGGLKDKFFVDAAAEYMKWLKKYADVEVVEVADSDVEKEAASVLPKLKGCSVLSDRQGREFKGSEEFADWLAGHKNAGRELTFVIGGSNGVSESVKKRADESVSFSRLTFPHRLFRVLLLEQIYRGFSIIEGGKYHK